MSARRLEVFLLAAAMLVAAWATPAVASAATPTTFIQTNLVTDNQTALAGDGALSNHTAANHTDTSLVNPWGLAQSATGPFVVANNGAGEATMYDGTGTAESPVVTIPAANGGMFGMGGGPTSPTPVTGVAYNASASFGGARFVFVTEDGTVATWSTGASATVRVDNANFTTTGPVYKGVAIARSGAVNRLYVTNFRLGTVDVFDSNFSHTTTPGGFADPFIPAGYAPFGIASIGNVLYVTYAQQDASKHDDLAGLGKGYLAAFDADGHLIGNQNLVSSGALNAPWAVALAPKGFGTFAGDLLVGNFGDGKINAFDRSGNAVGALTDDTSHTPVRIDGLWGLAIGKRPFGSPGALYFTAGILGESHGLFGSLTPVVPAAEVSRSLIDFGSERIGGNSASQTATLFSTGVLDLSVSGVDIVGSNRPDFRFVSDGCSHTAVPSRTSCSVAVRFRPSAAGRRTAVLRFLDDAGNSPQKVTLVGTAPNPTVKITKTKIDSKHQTATFTFRAAGATGFQCALVKPAHKKQKKPRFSSCKSPKAYKHLKHGKYTFEVRARSNTGVGPTTKRQFTI